MIVGFAGKMRSGKDTAAGYLKDCHNYLGLSFARALREEVEQAKHDKTEPPGMPTVVSHAFRAMAVEEIYRKPTTLNARIVLQWWGTDYRRNDNQEYWVRKLLYSMHPGANYAISDVRFASEAEAIRDNGGIVIKIERDADLDIPVGIPRHASEELNFDVDYVVQNNGSFQDLYEQIEKCLNQSKSSSLSTQRYLSQSSASSEAQLALLL